MRSVIMEKALHSDVFIRLQLVFYKTAMFKAVGCNNLLLALKDVAPKVYPGFIYC